MVNTNNYHHYTVFSSTNVITGSISGVFSSVSGYFALEDQNEYLKEQNEQLLEQIRDLQASNRLFIAEFEKDSTRIAGDSLLAPERNYSLIRADIVNMAVNRRLNYITLNKGRRDGVRDNMAVISTAGAVGTVAMSSERYSLVLPIINIESKTSCRIGLRAGRYLGSLYWDGINPRYAYLDEIPRHVQVQVGDTVVTSGFSDIYPADILVGRVEEVSLGTSDNFHTIKVELAEDFAKLTSVFVVAFEDNEELKQLNDSINNISWY